MIKSMLKFHNNIDVSKFSNLTAFLKYNSKGYIPQKASVFTDEEVSLFLETAPDEIYLVHKINIFISFVFLVLVLIPFQAFY